MRFDSLEEFLKYFYENGVNISDVEFNMDSVANPEEPAVVPDVLEEPSETPDDGPTQEPQKLEEYITLSLPSGDITVRLDKEGYLVAESCGMTPNSCGAGHVVINERKLFVNMCETDGNTVAYLPTTTGVVSVKVRSEN